MPYARSRAKWNATVNLCGNNNRREEERDKIDKIQC